MLRSIVLAYDIVHADPDRLQRSADLPALLRLNDVLSDAYDELQAAAAVLERAELGALGRGGDAAGVNSAQQRGEVAGRR